MQHMVAAVDIGLYYCCCCSNSNCMLRESAYHHNNNNNVKVAKWQTTCKMHKIYFNKCTLLRVNYNKITWPNHFLNKDGDFLD